MRDDHYTLGFEKLKSAFAGTDPILPGTRFDDGPTAQQQQRDLEAMQPNAGELRGLEQEMERRVDPGQPIAGGVMPPDQPRNIAFDPTSPAAFSPPAAPRRPPRYQQSIEPPNAEDYLIANTADNWKKSKIMGEEDNDEIQRRFGAVAPSYRQGCGCAYSWHRHTGSPAN